MFLTLTAAMVAGELRNRAERCLACLLEQTALASMEIVVLDISQKGEHLLNADHPSVRHIHRPDLLYYASAMAESTRQSHGEIIAFIEDHCCPDKEWAASIIKAFRRPIAILNYAFANYNPETYVSRACMMTEYGRWMVPVHAGPVPTLACNNIAYRRQALERYWDQLDDLFEAQFLLNENIRRGGGTAWLDPGAKVAHENWIKLSDGLLANGSMKRMLAVRRATLGAWGKVRRSLFALAMILSPPLHVWRLVRSLWNRPKLWPLFLASLPVSLAIYCYSSYQEALGYLFGVGHSREDFVAWELSNLRNR